MRVQREYANITCQWQDIMERIGWGFLQAFALHLVLTTSVIYCSCSRVSELRTMSVSRCVYFIWWMLLLFQFYFYLGTLLPGILTDTWIVTRYVFDFSSFSFWEAARLARTSSSGIGRSFWKTLSRGGLAFRWTNSRSMDLFVGFEKSKPIPPKFNSKISLKIYP